AILNLARLDGLRAANRDGGGVLAGGLVAALVGASCGRCARRGELNQNVLIAQAGERACGRQRKAVVGERRRLLEVHVGCTNANDGDESKDDADNGGAESLCAHFESFRYGAV